MFGFLKKKLKSGIDKIKKAVLKPNEHMEEIGVPKKVEDLVEQSSTEPSAKAEGSAYIKEEVFEEPIEEPREEVKPDEEKPEILEPIEEELERLEEKAAEPKPEAEEKQEEIEEKIEEAAIEEEIEHSEPIEKIKEEIFEIEKEEIKPEVPEIKPEKKEKEKPAKEKERKAAQKKEKLGFLEKIKKAITEKKISESDIKDVLQDLETSLIESDAALEVSEKIISDLKEALIGKSIPRGKIEKTINDSLKKSLLEILSVEKIDLLKQIKSKKPYLIIFLGFNGSGKTTTIARLGYLLQKQGLKVVFAAADCFRAASIEQIEEHGKNLGINIIKHKYGADPAAVIFDAVKHAKAKNIDVVLADTAGRSHANINLKEELKKICRVNNPDMKILVMDALTGNDVIEQAKTFNEAVGVDALILTKTDVYDKGGALLSSVHSINKPILYIGVGQEYEDLKEFKPEEIVKSLLE